MSAVVIDASVGIKWFVPEVHSSEARQWRHRPEPLHTLAFFFDLEISNILWKKVRRGELSRADAHLILGQLPVLALMRHLEAPLLTTAFDLANHARCSVYDCLYVALAAQLGGRMVTADQRLHSNLSATPWAANVCWVGDLPAP